jgi:hypothetical protein
MVPVMNAPQLDKAAKWSLTSDEMIEALRELVSLNDDFGTARITLFANGGAAVAVGSEHARSQFVGKTAEEALTKAKDTILKVRARA